MLNVLTIAGRLTKDPELKTTMSGKSIVMFTIANESDFERDESGKKKTYFFNCIAFSNAATFVHTYMKKGDMAIVNGSIRVNEWTDKNGNKRTTPEISCSNVYSVGGSKNTASDENGSQAQKNGYKVAGRSVDVEVDDRWQAMQDAQEEDLPFD